MLVKVVSIYLGSVIGAGFATGQEIMQFFILHGSNALKGAFVATFLFAYLGGLVMFLSVTMRSGSYKKLLNYLIGAKAGKFMDVLSLAMLLGGLSVMMAGSGAVLGEQLAWSSRSGILLMALLTSAVLLGGVEGVLAANVFIAPTKFLALAGISIAAILASGCPALMLVSQAPCAGGVAGHWAPASILYVSYNMVVPVAVLSSLGGTVSLKTGIAGGVIGGFLLGIAVILMSLAGLAYLPEAASYQIPFLYLARRLGAGFSRALGLLIWLAIFTTAIANAHGIASRLAPNGGRRYRLCGVGACLLALPLARYGFANLVRFLYPLFGLAGLVLLISLLFKPVHLFFNKNKKYFK